MAAGYKAMDEDGTTALINEAVEDVANDLIDWAALEIIFELHRAVKLGYYRELIDPDPSNIEKRGSGPHACSVVQCMLVAWYAFCNSNGSGKRTDQPYNTQPCSGVAGPFLVPDV